MDSDQASANTDHVTIRELQRHTRDVLDRAVAEGQIYITKHGRTIARILPPDPAEEQINAAIAAGILDPRALTEAYTNGEVLERFAPATRSSAEGSLTDTVIELRDAEGDR